MNTNRVIIIVLDSAGIGELPDAAEYNDEGSNTLGNISKQCGGLSIPNMCALGIGKIEGIDYLHVPEKVLGCYGRMAEVSKGKDTITGHWEMSGVHLERAFPVYPNGFPKEIIDEFEKSIGIKTLGNVAASGTEIIKELGARHVETGYPIVYTSADSVFQIAAHEEIVPIERLYKMCSEARKILAGKHAVGRVVARPFTGTAGNFVRTSNRKDFSLPPVSPTILEELKAKGFNIVAIGKIEDIFSGKGITEAVHTKNNMHGIDVTIDYLKSGTTGLIFTNLVDFDMLYGHRNDATGYKSALEEFDRRLPEIFSCMKDNDILFVTADHGCDPTTPSTDHSREYVPIIAFGKSLMQDVDLGTRTTFSDVASTVAELLGVECILSGTSFKNLIISDNT